MRIKRMKEHLDLPGKEKELADLESESSKADFWQEQSRARQAMQRMARLKETVERWKELEAKCNDLSALVDLDSEDIDSSMGDELAAEVDDLERRFEDLEFLETLSGEYDINSAFLAIHAGAGGTESQDWANMLLRMYLRWCENRRYQTEIIDTSPGEETGIKSALVEIKGDYAYGYLKAEKGVHRLVRLSPFDADHARHTSFALVEVMPEVGSDVDIDINPSDLNIETFRSSGPGGQHMQKTSSAVRITHIPTGVVASCQSDRSQGRNKEHAMRVLRGRLLQMEMERKAEEQARLKGEHVSAGWGNQIRSYVLHPYRMVKDHRTGFETSNAEAVLEGDLDDFMKAYLKSALGT
ncbi:MAG: peptide chain release factor 2 [Chloroflexota bacterium]